MPYATIPMASRKRVALLATTEPLGYVPPAEYEARYDEQAAVA